MIQVFRLRLKELIPLEESLVDIMTRDDIAIIQRKRNNPRDEMPIGINIISHGDRGFGEWGSQKYYMINKEKKEISQTDDFIYRHTDKCSSSPKYYLEETVSIEDLITEFQNAGYTLN